MAYYPSVRLLSCSHPSEGVELHPIYPFPADERVDSGTTCTEADLEFLCLLVTFLETDTSLARSMQDLTCCGTHAESPRCTLPSDDHDMSHWLVRDSGSLQLGRELSGQKEVAFGRPILPIEHVMMK